MSMSTGRPSEIFKIQFTHYKPLRTQENCIWKCSYFPGQQHSQSSAVWACWILWEEDGDPGRHSQPDEPLQPQQGRLHPCARRSVSTTDLNIWEMMTLHTWHDSLFWMGKKTISYQRMKRCPTPGGVFTDVTDVTPWTWISWMCFQVGGVPGAQLQRTSLHPGEAWLQQFLRLGKSEQHSGLNAKNPLQLKPPRSELWLGSGQETVSYTPAVILVIN